MLERTIDRQLHDIAWENASIGSPGPHFGSGDKFGEFSSDWHSGTAFAHFPGLRMGSMQLNSAYLA